MLKQTGDVDGAIDALEEAGTAFQADRRGDPLPVGAVCCGCGRASCLASGGLGAAEADLLEAEAYFARGYEEFGTHYPRINQLSTRFVRAGLARRREDAKSGALVAARSETDATAMLDDPLIWSKVKPHDTVWAPASRGEACLLLRRWKEAEAAYGDARRAAGGDAFPPKRPMGAAGPANG